MLYVEDQKLLEIIKTQSLKSKDFGVCSKFVIQHWYIEYNFPKIWLALYFKILATSNSPSFELKAVQPTFSAQKKRLLRYTHPLQVEETLK